MKNLKMIVAVSVMALLVLSFVGCTSKEPGKKETTAIPTSVSVAETEDITEITSTHAAPLPDPSETESPILTEEDDLEIMTVPQEYSNVHDNTEASEKVTEAEIFTTIINDSMEDVPSTESQKIELPFVPANQ